MKKRGSDPGRDPEAEVDLGEQVDVTPRKRSGAMVAVRLSADLLNRVDEYALANGMTMSDVLREGVERVIAGSEQVGPLIVSGTILVTGAGQTYGRASGGQGRSRQLEGFDIRAPELTLAG